MKLILVIVLFAVGGWLLQLWAGRGRPPAAGDAAPEFSLPDAQGRVHRLADYRGRWVVLYFYPKADTPGCTREACALRDQWAAFRQLNVAVLGVSMDAPSAQGVFAAKNRLPFPLLSDVSGRVAETYGSVWDLAVLRFPKRHTFLIGPDGCIARVFLQVKPSAHATELLDALRDFGLAA